MKKKEKKKNLVFKGISKKKNFLIKKKNLLIKKKFQKKKRKEKENNFLLSLDSYEVRDNKGNNWSAAGALRYSYFSSFFWHRPVCILVFVIITRARLQCIVRLACGSLQ